MYIVVRTEGKHNMRCGCVCVLVCVYHVHVCSVCANFSQFDDVFVLKDGT